MSQACRAESKNPEDACLSMQIRGVLPMNCPVNVYSLRQLSGLASQRGFGERVAHAVWGELPESAFAGQAFSGFFDSAPKGIAQEIESWRPLKMTGHNDFEPTTERLRDIPLLRPIQPYCHWPIGWRPAPGVTVIE